MHGYEASYRLLADTVGGIGMSYDCIEDRMTIFGDSAELLSIPSQVDKFSVYLEKEEKDISLTKEQLEWMVAEGMVGNEHTIEVKCKTADGSWSHFSLIFSVLYTDKAYYRPISLIGCLMDIEADYSEKEKLRKMSQYDQLTGLYNRAGAEAVMDQYVQKTEGFKNDILVMIDVDDFKNFNDTYGHNCGDDILVYIGSRLQNIFRKDDVLCRWGGDEFYLYLFKAAKNTDRINTRCQELQEEMRQYQYEGKEIPITISIGGVVVGEHSQEDAFKLADQALYSVKKSGRNSVYIVEE